MLTKQQIKSAGSIFYANSAGCNPSINVIEALAESLQHAPTKPGAPLSDEEWKGLMRNVSDLNPNCRPAIDAVLDKRNTAQPTKSLVDHCAKVAEQVAEMPDWKKGSVVNKRSIASTAQADWDDQHRGTQAAPCVKCGQTLTEEGVGGEYPCDVCGVPTLHDPQPAPVDGDLAKKAHSAFMSAPDKPWDAVVRLVADYLLEAVADEEWYAPDDGKTIHATRYGVDQILANRRKLLEAKPKTLGERMADVLISKGPDNPEQYRAIAAELAELAKETE